MVDIPLERRTLLKAAGVAAAGAATVGGSLALTLPAEAETSTTFQHGVASGDPLPDGILLWTRVTPTSDAAPGSGVGPTVGVAWEVATDATFSHVVHSGTLTTGPERDHTVKVEVSGLQPATAYYYRFRLGTASSRVGRTHTAPAYNADVRHLRFGVVSCSNWEGGFFSAYRHLAARGDLDAVVHLGDYIYEYGDRRVRGGRPGGPPAQSHARDHHAGRLPDPARDVQDRSGPAQPARTRAVDPHLGRPRGGGQRMVGRGGEPPAGDRGQLGALGTLFGLSQNGLTLNADAWDGYNADREQLVNFLRDRQVSNVVFITGDIHSSWANELTTKATVLSPTAVEFVVTSVTSDNVDDITHAPPDTLSQVAVGIIQNENPHVKWAELDQHGYGVLDVTPERCRMDYYFLTDRTRPDSGKYLAKSFSVASGVARLREEFVF